MPLIECRLGQTQQTVAGHTYAFERDRFGRFVTAVHNHDHAAIFLAVEHYVEVPDEPAQAQALAAQETPVVATAGIVPPQGKEQLQDPVPPAPPVPDVTDIKGIGAAMREKLAGIGITTVAQIAALTPDDVTRIDEQLNLRGAIDRAGWISQAQALTAQEG